MEHHLIEVVRRWKRLMELDGLAGALMLYAPDARLRAGTVTVSGRRNITPNFRISSADSFWRKSQIVEQWV